MGTADQRHIQMWHWLGCQVLCQCDKSDRFPAKLEISEPAVSRGLRLYFFRATRVYIARNVPRRGVCPSLYRTTLRYSTLRHSKLGDSVITNYSELNKERISLCHTAVQTRMFARHSGLEVLGDQDPLPSHAKNALYHRLLSFRGQVVVKLLFPWIQTPRLKIPDYVIGCMHPKVHKTFIRVHPVHRDNVDSEPDSTNKVSFTIYIHILFKQSRANIK